MPLEDELEALCRLHVARAELVLSGDLESFIGVAATVEAFAFREDSDDSDEGEATDFNPPPAMFAFSLSAGDGSPGGPEGAQKRLDDGRKRRLAALENCLDAFDRLGEVFPRSREQTGAHFFFSCAILIAKNPKRKGEGAVVVPRSRPATCVCVCMFVCVCVVVFSGRGRASAEGVCSL